MNFTVYQVQVIGDNGQFRASACAVTILDKARSGLGMYFLPVVYFALSLKCAVFYPSFNIVYM